MLYIYTNTPTFSSYLRDLALEGIQLIKPFKTIFVETGKKGLNKD